MKAFSEPKVVCAVPAVWTVQIDVVRMSEKSGTAFEKGLYAYRRMSAYFLYFVCAVSLFAYHADCRQNFFEDHA